MISILCYVLGTMLLLCGVAGGALAIEMFAVAADRMADTDNFARGIAGGSGLFLLGGAVTVAGSGALLLGVGSLVSTAEKIRESLEDRPFRGEPSIG